MNKSELLCLSNAESDANGETKLNAENVKQERGKNPNKCVVPALGKRKTVA